MMDKIAGFIFFGLACCHFTIALGKPTADNIQVVILNVLISVLLFRCARENK